MTLATLAPQAEVLLRAAYGLVLFAHIGATLPHASRYYVSARWRGFVEPGPWVDRLLRPGGARAFVVLWAVCALGVAFDIGALPAALVNVAFARYFSVTLRWRSVLRGMGAPGHMNYWLATLVAFLLLSRSCDIAGVLHRLTVVTFRIDFAALLIASGSAKVAAGYLHNDGVQIGLANPWWARWPALTNRVHASGRLFGGINFAICALEIGAGASLLIPAFAGSAAIVIAGSFLTVGRFVRLGGLAEMVAICCLLFITPATPIGRFLASMPLHAASAAAPPWAWPLVFACCACLAAYLAMLPFAYAGMAVNFYGRRRLPAPVQRFLDAWTRFFGLSLWRVFTADITNFYCELYAQGNGPRRRLPARVHVGESICLATIFTTLKYHPGMPQLFRDRVTCYARTLDLADGERAIFRYISILPNGSRFDHVPVREFCVDTAAGTVEERALDSSVNVRSPSRHSPVHAGTQPGTYA